MKRKRNILFIFATLFLLITIPTLMEVNKTAKDVWGATTIEGKWIKSNGRWWYKHTDGSYTKSAWEYISGKWYYFDDSGWMVTGWLDDGGKWYYLGGANDGAMKTGWKSISGSWYYFSPSKTSEYSMGQMVTGWLTLSEKKYYLAENGVMLTGEVVMEGKKYTFNSSGALTSEVSTGSLSSGEKIAAAALNAINTVYVKDGESLSSGCDSEGFIYAVLTSCGYTVPKTLEEQSVMGTAVAEDSLQPGDVILYEGDVDYGAIYLGDDRVIYMSGQRFGVRMVSLDHLGEWRLCRRVY